MSTIDFSNQKVLKNFSLAQAREGKGELFIRPETICFKSETGAEFTIPKENEEEFRKKLGINKETPVKEEKEDKTEGLTKDEMQILRKAYKEKTGKGVPPVYTNDSKWIRSKL